MKDFYNMFESVFDIDPNKEFDDKYISGKSPEEIEWMMTNNHPKTKEALMYTIYGYCDKYGWDSDLNWIDVTAIRDMSRLFDYFSSFRSKFNGDISKWDVSNVEDMSFMFRYSKFRGNVDNWDVSRVKNMHDIFYGCPLKYPVWYKD